ncbi:helix-turn-helix domain-containing protein [Haematobacter missouriensis]|uniref:Replication protein C n=1 Tax=Haematobacter missouriensis TaxID=366616 RepID=A0ABX3ZZQ2_9RHOB|nr:helix-turn-helix domain-containing protein [Haematobacter missouriensis]OWJ79753.1 replication protein C [Haematobacter missouriensis]
MKHITSTALAAGAQEICVKAAEHSLPGMGSITLQPAFRPVTRREIMAAVNTCGRDLCLRPSTLVVLDALLSCLPCQSSDGRELPVSPTTLLTVYASNETLCFRAKGLTDRQLRRHLEVLEASGLIQRRDSANGKRFPVMRQGKAIGAFGLDLSPLFARADELLALAHRRREEADELRGLRAQILHLRAACLNLALDATAASFVDGLRNLIRRASLTLTEARAALAQLTAVVSRRSDTGEPKGEAAKAVSDHPAVIPSESPAQETDPGHIVIDCETEKTIQIQPQNTPKPTSRSDQMPASDGQNVRHIEQESDSKKRTRESSTLPCWDDLTEVSAFYAEPANAQEARVIAFEFGKMLRISQDLLARATSKLGLWALLRLEDRMARQIADILNPDAYLRSVLRS